MFLQSFHAPKMFYKNPVLFYVSAAQRAQVHSFSINWVFLPLFFHGQQMLSSQHSFTKRGNFLWFLAIPPQICREQIASTIKTYLHWIIFVRIIFSLRTDLFSSMEIQTKPVDCQGWMDLWILQVWSFPSWTLLSLFSLSTHVIKGVSSTSKRWSLSNGFCENVTKENLCWLTKSTWLFSQRRRFKCGKQFFILKTIKNTYRNW